MNNKKLPNFRRWLTVSTVLVPLSLISVAASAGIMDLGFTANGSSTWGGSCGPSCTDLKLTGTTSLWGLAGHSGPAAPFTFSALLDVTPDHFGSAATGTPPSGGWVMQDSSGDSLHGSISGWLSSSGGAAGWGVLDFSITGGSGLFDDVSGSGGSLLGFSSNGQFSDAGLLRVNSPTAPASVPEPSGLTLFAAALAALGWAAGRRYRGERRTSRRVIEG